MSLTHLPIEEDTLYPAHCKFCICFEDTDYIVNPGGRWAIQLALVVQPLDGDTFSIDGVQFTYRTVPVGVFDILIGGSVTATLNNTAAAISSLQFATPANYLILPIISVIFIFANRPGSEFDIVYAQETSPLFVMSLTPGVDIEVKSPYKILVQLHINISLSGFEFCLIDNIIAIPKLTTDKFTGDPELEVCIPVDQFIRDVIKSPIPVLGTLVPPFLEIQYQTLALMFFRFAVEDTNGVGIFEVSDDSYSFTNALCADKDAPGVALFDHSYFNNVDAKFLHVIDTDQLTFCAGTEFLLYAHVAGDTVTPVTWTLQVTTFPSQGGGASIYVENIVLTRDGILCMNITGIADQSETILDHYEGIASVNFGDDMGRNFQIIIINYRSRKERECCDCRSVFYYLNKFGRWDILEGTCESFFKMDITAQDFYGCESCFSPPGGTLIYNKTYEEEFRIYTHRLPNTDYTRERLVDFFSSPEVYMVKGDDNDLIPVVVLGDEQVLVSSASNKVVQIPIRYKPVSIKKSITNL